MRRFTERRFKARIQGLQFQSFQIVQAERLWAGIQTAERTVYALLMLAVAFLYLEYVLTLFPWTKATSLKLFTIFLNPIRQMAAAVLAAVPNLVFLAILILVVRYGLQMLRLFFSGIARGTLTLARLRPPNGPCRPFASCAWASLPLRS